MACPEKAPAARAGQAVNLMNFPLDVCIIVVNRMLRLRLAGKF